MYQGTEFWDFSFVDPDNRRPVDYPALERALSDLGDASESLAHWPDGRVKQITLAKLLADRAARPAFYAEADYRAIEAAGPHAGNVIAYLRSDATPEGDLFVAVPRLVAGLVTDSVWSGAGLAGTTVDLGDGTTWHDIVTGAGYEGTADLGDLFARLPYAVLRRRA